MATSGSGILLRFKHAFNDSLAIPDTVLLTLGDQKKVLLNDRVLVELLSHPDFVVIGSEGTTVAHPLTRTTYSVPSSSSFSSPT